MRWGQSSTKRGNQWWPQVLVNEQPESLKHKPAAILGIQPQEIHWLSPLKEDDYSEYSDIDFIDRLGISLDEVPVGSFWPGRGPVWNGLGKTDRGDKILVEAKARMPKIAPSPTDVR